jgi:multicomponent Na+:H+ antiporter subunit D
VNTTIIFPYLCLISVAALCLIFFKNTKVQGIISAVGSGTLVALTLNMLLTVQNRGIQVLQIGNWPAPYGITFAVDLASGLLVLTSSIVFFAINIFSLKYVDEHRKSKGYYFLINVFMLGAVAAYCTGDIFNLYVCFEILMVATFMLLTLGGSNYEIRQGLPYLVLNVIASFCLLIGIALIYGHAGNLNMAYLASLLRKSEWTYGIRTASIFIFFAFAVKSALFPLFFWLPRAYPTVPGAIGALFSAVLTKVGIYALLRVFTLVFPIARDPQLQNVLYYCALITMIVGVLGAIAQTTMKKILSVHIISQVGYMAWGLALFSPISLGAALFFMVHNMVVKSNLFLISGLIENIEGTDDLSQLGGLLKKNQFLASLFLLSALSLSGFPPLSGFFGKIFLIKEALGLEDFMGVGVAAVVSLLTLLSMIKIWNEVFLKEKSEGHSNMLLTGGGMAPILFLALFAVLLGALSAPIYETFISAGNALFDPADYLVAVLGQEGI